MTPPESLRTPLRIHRDRFPGRPAFDTAVSHAMLRRVAVGALPESLRLYVPDDALLFSSLDARNPGFDRACALATEAGFSPVIRLAGGHAAAFLARSSLAFAWASPDPDAHLHIRPRFERLSALVVRALRRLGLDAAVGELPGEYCPGEYSVHIAGRDGERIKVMGVGQRVIRGGAHVGGVLTVDGTQGLRAVLAPVYEALGLELRPETAGGVADAAAGVDVEAVIAALLEVLRDDGLEPTPAPLERDTLRTAEPLVPLHSARRRGADADAPLRSTDAKALMQADRLARRPDPEPDRGE